MTYNLSHRILHIHAFWRKVFITLIIVLLSSIYSLLKLKIFNLRFTVIELVACTLYISLYLELNSIYLRFIRRRLPQKTHFKIRLFYQCLGITLLVILTGALLDIMNYLTPAFFINGNLFIYAFSHVIENSLFSLAVIITVYNILQFLKIYEEGIIENEQLKKEALVTRYEVLKNQISPHFLFNSLNALMVLIPKDPDLSVLYTQNIANFYRQVLNYSEKLTISLAEEVALIQDYIFIFKKRFGEKLNIIIDLPSDIGDLWIMPFTLQMLVENAVKHNIISVNKPLTIKISICEQQIVVQNNLQTKKLHMPSANIGLANITNRYKLLTTQDVTIMQTDSEFNVAVPLIFSDQG